MMRLVKKGLMFGNLFEVASPSLVQRYNRALEHLTGKTTRLTEFHIDISGYSPEIGDELDDENYLNQNGCNRQFIILSIEQKKAPLLNAHFSTSRSILRHYINSHEEQLFALTLRDAVAGELVNQLYNVEKPKDLFGFKQIEVEADTVEAHVAAGDKLQLLIDDFMDEQDAWWDDVLIADMIELSKHTGNIITSPLKLNAEIFTQGNFYTAHFGGIYVFRDVVVQACISTQPIEIEKSSLPVTFSGSLKDRREIANFLKLNDLVENIAENQHVDGHAILQQKLDFIAIDVAAGQGEDLTGVSRGDLRAIKRKYHSDMPAQYHTLAEITRQLRHGEEISSLVPDDPGYFYLLRAKPHRDQDLINMLLAELTQLDFRQLFICHKDAFYRQYKNWSDEKKDYVVKFLSEEYVVDKVGTRQELFGCELSMSGEDNVHPPQDLGRWSRIPRAGEGVS